MFLRRRYGMFQFRRDLALRVFLQSNSALCPGQVVQMEIPFLYFL
jgi:hypothetical protein